MQSRSDREVTQVKVEFEPRPRPVRDQWSLYILTGTITATIINGMAYTLVLAVSGGFRIFEAGWDSGVTVAWATGYIILAIIATIAASRGYLRFGARR